MFRAETFEKRTCPFKTHFNIYAIRVGFSADLR